MEVKNNRFEKEEQKFSFHISHSNGRFRIMADIALYLLLGLVIGTISGLIGIGGGVLIVPALIYLFSMTQHQAQGTTLSLLVPPIGLLAAWTYYKQGFVDIKIAAFICLGFFIGGYIGAKIAVALPADVLRKIFGFAMLLVAIHMIFFK